MTDTSTEAVRALAYRLHYEGLYYEGKNGDPERTTLECEIAATLRALVEERGILQRTIEGDRADISGLIERAETAERKRDEYHEEIHFLTRAWGDLQVKYNALAEAARRLNFNCSKRARLTERFFNEDGGTCWWDPEAQRLLPALPADACLWCRARAEEPEHWTRGVTFEVRDPKPPMTYPTDKPEPEAR